jgi:hypothetical protein
MAQKTGQNNFTEGIKVQYEPKSKRIFCTIQPGDIRKL